MTDQPWSLCFGRRVVVQEAFTFIIPHHGGLLEKHHKQATETDPTSDRGPGPYHMLITQDYGCWDGGK